jgi:hypothetical protein
MSDGFMSNDHVFFFFIKTFTLSLNYNSLPSQCNGNMSMVCQLKFFEATQFLN